MSHRTSPHADVLHLDDPDSLPCTITGCMYEGVNLVRKTVHFDSSITHKSVARCRFHTSMYDQIIVGPGPL